MADDSPYVHAAGTDPDRVLIAGDGVASGRGVLTHDLGLPGYLARSLTALTGHATDVDSIVHPNMTVHSCFAELAGINLFRFDVVLLSVGHNEVLDLMSVSQWVTGLRALLAEVETTAAAATQIFILAIPSFGNKTKMPSTLSRVVDAHAQVLNAATAQVAFPANVTVVPFSDDNQFEPETRHAYQRWADNIAFHISKTLDPDRVPAADYASIDEQGRQTAVEHLHAGTRGRDPVLDDITETARQVFGTSTAAITFVRSTSQVTRSVSGAAPYEIARDGTFCDVTIRRSTQHIVEDTADDLRFAQFASEAGSPAVRFYAGYPIESPDGHRVGALCVMDDRPREFTQADVKLLRTLAHLVQHHLWR